MLSSFFKGLMSLKTVALAAVFLIVAGVGVVGYIYFEIQLPLEARARELAKSPDAEVFFRACGYDAECVQGADGYIVFVWINNKEGEVVKRGVAHFPTAKHGGWDKAWFAWDVPVSKPKPVE